VQSLSAEGRTDVEARAERSCWMNGPRYSPNIFTTRHGSGSRDIEVGQSCIRVPSRSILRPARSFARHEQPGPIRRQ
jgi:hypothetical protein